MNALDKPECGYWRLRLGKNAPYVAASIQYEQTLYEPGEPSNRLDRWPVLTARISGELVLLAEVWERRREPITKAQAAYMIADARWVKAHKPDEPLAEPTKPVNFLQAPLPF